MYFSDYVSGGCGGVIEAGGLFNMFVQGFLYSAVINKIP